jgi:hypothetical protein
MGKLVRLSFVAGSLAALMTLVPKRAEAQGSCWADQRVNGDVMCSWTECDVDGDGFLDQSHFNGCFEKDGDGHWVPIQHPTT